VKTMPEYYLKIYCHTPGEDREAWVEVDSLGIHPDTALRLAELGLIDYRPGQVPASQAGRLLKILRLRRSLGVNLAGAAIIVNLLERLEKLQEEIESIKRG